MERTFRTSLVSDIPRCDARHEGRINITSPGGLTEIYDVTSWHVRPGEDFWKLATMPDVGLKGVATGIEFYYCFGPAVNCAPLRFHTCGLVPLIDGEPVPTASRFVTQLNTGFLVGRFLVPFFAGMDRVTVQAGVEQDLGLTGYQDFAFGWREARR